MQLQLQGAHACIACLLTRSLPTLCPQTTMLLSGLGVPDTAFLSLQDRFFQSVLSMTDDSDTAFKFLAANSQVRMLPPSQEWLFPSGGWGSSELRSTCCISIFL